MTTILSRVITCYALWQMICQQREARWRRRFSEVRHLSGWRADLWAWFCYGHEYGTKGLAVPIVVDGKLARPSAPLGCSG